MASVRPHFVPIPTQDAPESGRLILRDGTTASIRVAHSNDEAAMTQFFASLSNESRRHRFFSQVVPDGKLVSSFCDASDPRKRLTLIVTQLTGGVERVIAVGTYMARDATAAEIGLAVADACQGKGIGTLMLERLALIAAANGIRHFWAMTMFENQQMLDVFRESGFDCRTKTDRGVVEIDLSLVPSAASVAHAELCDRVATAASLRPFFHPNAVAIVGASRNPANIGTRLLQAAIDAGFQGTLYPINPKTAAIGSLRAYPSVRDLPEAPDLTVIVVPRDAVLEVVDDCAARGVRAVVVITAGFAEIGAEGRELQRQLVDKVRGHGMRMVGPNCLGLLNTDPAVRLNASFAPDFPPPGRIAFSSQSGALGLAIISLARQRGLGLSKFVSVGNKADVSGNDLLQYWEQDGQTDVILLYLESFGNPRRFARIVSRVSRHKPIVAVKAGRTGAGKRAASSHTAALAASDVAVDALFHQTGVIRAESLGEMFDLAAALSAQPLPDGRRVALLTNAGGLGILCADTCEANGLQVQELSEATKNHLKEFLPAAASVMNPIDMIASASAENFAKATELLLCDHQVDALIVLTIHVGLADISAIARGIAAGVSVARAKSGAGKPVLTCIMDGDKLSAASALNGERLPNYAFPENAARVLGKLANYADWRKQPQGMIPEFDDMQPQAARRLCQSIVKERGTGWLDAEEVRQVLKDFSLPVSPSAIGRSADAAAQAARYIGFPVALKLASRQIVHKTEFGGVQLNLQDEIAVRAAFATIHERLADAKRLDAFDGVLVQPMIGGGVELMVGITQDPSFGPLIAFGLGGIYVEILQDVCFRVTPITDRDAKEMVRAIHGSRLLEGYRGHPPADITAIEDLLLRVARLVEEIPEITELDLNPVIALPPGQGCCIVDARIRVSSLG
ncbi:MAG: bifunctional acetate--CoA ligase family protein/GNAT family N-acetyltransferase [Candidatus Binatia bacterium]